MICFMLTQNNTRKSNNKQPSSPILTSSFFFYIFVTQEYPTQPKVNAIDGNCTVVVSESKPKIKHIKNIEERNAEQWQRIRIGRYDIDSGMETVWQEIEG